MKGFLSVSLLFTQFNNSFDWVVSVFGIYWIKMLDFVTFKVVVINLLVLHHSHCHIWFLRKFRSKLTGKSLIQDLSVKQISNWQVVLNFLVPSLHHDIGVILFLIFICSWTCISARFNKLRHYHWFSWAWWTWLCRIWWLTWRGWSNTLSEYKLSCYLVVIWEGLRNILCDVWHNIHCLRSNLRF